MKIISDQRLGLKHLLTTYVNAVFLNQWVKEQLKIASLHVLFVALFDKSDPRPPDLFLDRKYREKPRKKIQQSTSPLKKRNSCSTGVQWQSTEKWFMGLKLEWERND